MFRPTIAHQKLRDNTSSDLELVDNMYVMFPNMDHMSQLKKN